LNLKQILEEKKNTSWFTSEEIYQFMCIMIQVLTYFEEKHFIHKNIRPGYFLDKF